MSKPAKCTPQDEYIDRVCLQGEKCDEKKLFGKITAKVRKCSQSLKLDDRDRGYTVLFSLVLHMLFLQILF